MSAIDFLISLPGPFIDLTAIHPTTGKITGRTFSKNLNGTDTKAREVWIESATVKGYGVYFNINSLSVPLGPQRPKAKTADVSVLNAFHVDADVSKDIVDSTEFAAAKTELLRSIRGMNKPPTIIIDSGNGYGLFWMLRNPVKVTAANRDQFTGINIALRDAVPGAADACQNLDRVMRVPFTTNFPNATKIKRGRVEVATDLIADDRDMGVFYDVEDFESAPVETVSPPTAPADDEAIDIPDTVDLSRLDADMRKLVEQGPAEGEKIGDGSRSAYSFMVACALVELGFTDGEIVAVLTNPDYKVSEHVLAQKQRTQEATATKMIRDARARGATTATEEFAAEPPPEPTAADAKIIAAGERERDAIQAAAKETWESIKSGWVYVGQQKQFVRLSDGKMWDVDAFEKQFGYVKDGMRDAMGRSPPSLTKAIFACLPGTGLKTFDSFIFMPGQPERYKGDFNSWRKSDIEPKQGSTALWDSHLAYLFADERVRDLVLNWMAWVYQNPTLHPNHSLMVHGKIQGTGKTVLARVLSKLLSSTPATPLSQHTLEADHAAWPIRTKLAVIEVRAANRKLSDMLHDLITGPTVHVDMKGAHDFDMLNVIAYWLETNKGNALAGLDNSDRRHLVTSTDEPNKPLQPKPQSYYDALYPAILDDPAALAAIAYSLKTRDLKGYSGLHRAPSTDAKTAMMREAADDVEKWMIEHRDDVPLCRSLTSVDEILTAMPEDVRNIRGARNRVAEVLTEQFNGESLGKVRLGGRLQPRLWAINKRSDVSVRDATKDGQLAQMYRNERWTPPTTLTPAERASLAQAQAEFEADPV